MQTEPRKKVLGVNDDRDFCSCCGKEHLKRVVWIEDLETGRIDHFGTTCATKAAPVLFGEIKEAVKRDDNRSETAWSMAHARYRKEGGKYRTEYDPKHPGSTGHARIVPLNPDRLKEIRDAALAALRNGVNPWSLPPAPEPAQLELFPA